MWVWGAHLSCQVREPVCGNTTIICDAWPVRRQTYGYLPSLRRFQFTLLGDRDICVCEQLVQGCTRQCGCRVGLNSEPDRELRPYSLVHRAIRVAPRQNPQCDENPLQAKTTPSAEIFHHFV